MKNLLLSALMFFAIFTAKADSTLLISAAMSMKDALPEITSEFKKTMPDAKLEINLGSSGMLQQQIENGAAVDIFISASTVNMDKLIKKGLIVKDSEFILVNNKIVLIVAPKSEIKSIKDLSNLLVKTIAIGEPSSVPVGAYAVEYMKNASIYDELKAKFVFAKDTRQVLTYVSKNNAEAGFVYGSDVISDPSVKVIYEIPASMHSPINYPAAIVKNTKHLELAKKFNDFLKSDIAKKIFIKYGFSCTEK